MSKGLLTILEEKPNCNRLAKDLEKIRERAEQLLPRIIQTFPEYTMHDINHSDRILEVLGRILPDTLKEELNGYEVFFLASAAYYHDIGMINFPELSIPSKLNDTKAIASYIREQHHTRSEVFITTAFTDLRIEDIHQAKIIGRIARGHRKENLQDKNLFESDRTYKGAAINVQLLAALLRLGDTLDITFERTPIVVYEHLPLKDLVSLDEWKKHLSISGVAPLPDDPLTIKSNATCSSPKIHRLLKKIEKDTNDQLDYLPSFLHQYRQHTRELPRKFYILITAEGYQAFDFKFSLQENEITKLLMGDKLYQSKDESIRELLKNSVDACRARKEKLKKVGLSYSPIIKIEEFSDSRLSIKDNGIGMNEDIIERYFTKIGTSFYNSTEFSENYAFTPVSELGIGFLSSFMVAEKIVLETKTDNDLPIIVEIDSVSDFFIVRKGETQETGTTVILFLKKGIGISFEDALKRYARHIEFPIEFRKFDKREAVQIFDSGFQLKIKDSKYWPIFPDQFTFYKKTVKEDSLEGIIGLVAQKNGEFGITPLNGNEFPFRFSLYPIIEKDNNRIVSYEGIFVGNSNFLPSWLNSGFCFYDFNLKKKALDLNIARNSIVQDNQKYAQFSALIEGLVVKLLEDFLQDLERRSLKLGIDFSLISTNFFSDYLAIDSVEIMSLNNLPVALINLIKNYGYVRCFTKNGMKSIRASEILKRNCKVIPLFNLDEYPKSEIRRIMGAGDNFSEENIYPSMEFGAYRWLSLIFDNYQSIDFMSLFQYTPSQELNGLIPQGWRLLKFSNYSSKRLIEFSHGQITILNRDNRFLDLIINNRGIIVGTRKLALSMFFETLKSDLRKDFSIAQQKQRDIMAWFVSSRIIKKEEMEKYILTKADFPSQLL